MRHGAQYDIGTGSMRNILNLRPVVQEMLYKDFFSILALGDVTSTEKNH